MTGRSAHSVARRARHRLRSRVCEYPAIYLPLARRKYPGPSPEVIGPDTEIVIDGYTRCASTFAVYAFQSAQTRPVRLAHHLHAPAQLVRAARDGVPALVVIREPKGAVLSQVIREPGVGIRDAVASYARFYERLMPYRDSFTVADFTEVTTDFGSAVRRLNERFSTGYREFSATQSNVAECFDFIRWRGTLSETLLGFESGLVDMEHARRARATLERAAGGRADPQWIPSRDRDRAKAMLRDQWNSPRLARLRRRAYVSYRTFLAAEPGTPAIGVADLLASTTDERS